MSFVINQAETFNYKTNYELVNVSHLTQPTPKQNRTFSGGEVEERKRRREEKGGDRGRRRYTENYYLTDMFVEIFILIVLMYA